MKIEAGKFYKTRNGLKVRIYATDAGGDYPVHGAIYLDKEEGAVWKETTWTLSGVYMRNAIGSSLDSDLVSEWREPHPAESWPVDKPLYVQIYKGESWGRRHFAKFEDGKVWVYFDGRTSFSAHHQHITSVWAYRTPEEYEAALAS